MEHAITTAEKTLCTPNVLLNAALDYAARGWRVLPLHTVMNGRCTCDLDTCSSPGKHPRTVNGVKAATSEETQLRKWWDLWPDANIGIATGEGLLVVDIDPKHGGSVGVLESLITLPQNPLSVSTGGDGWHFYFSYNPVLEIANTAGKLAVGIDTRGKNGYVVAPPSLHASGKTYQWVDENVPLSAAPTGLIPLLLGLRKVPAVPAPVSVQKPGDTLVSIQTPREGVPEGQRNTQLHHLASQLRREGANEAVLQTMLKTYNQKFCIPPLLDDEVSRIIASAMKYGQEGRPDFSWVESIGPARRGGGDVLSRPRWIVQDILPEGVTLLVGKPKIGKSWMSLALALAVAQGETAFGKLATTRGKVIYLALEDTERRILARTDKLLGTTDLPENNLWGYRCPPMHAQGLLELSILLQKHEGVNLLIIDTLGKVRPPSSGTNGLYQDDYAFIAPFKQLADRYHMAIVLVHHLNKKEGSDPMDLVSGSNGLTGAVDSTLVLLRERNEEHGKLQVMGRDVEECELPLKFDKERCLWTYSEQPTKQFTRKIHQDIMDVLQGQSRPLSVADIASRLGLEDTGALRKALGQLKSVNAINTPKWGVYAACDSPSSSLALNENT